MADSTNCLFLIPARVGSTRIPGKNFRVLAGVSPVERAAMCAMPLAQGLASIVVTTDNFDWTIDRCLGRSSGRLTGIKALYRVSALASETALMIDVVKDAVSRWPGGDPVVLLQPTQPLRKPETVRKAINLLTPDMDSVVTIGLDRFVRDGTAYVFWRLTVERYGTIYGEKVVLMPVPANETCPLDTPEDWIEAERRLQHEH